jgi:hypothetical protein
LSKTVCPARTGKDKQKMSVKVASNRFIVPSVTDFYSKLLSRVSNVLQLGKYLVREAENAQVFRQTKRVEECGAVLAHMPEREYQLIGQYYLAWSAYRKGEDAQDVLENVFERSRTYKTRSLIILAALEGRKGNSSTELRYLLDSLKLADDVAMKIKISRAIAVVKSKEGYHKAALKDLENIGSLVRYTTIQAQCDYLNSLAVELGEAGRIQEAQDVCKVVLASPLIGVYPEWRETGADTARRGYKSRSSVSIIQSFLEPEKQPEKIQNVLYMPGRNAAPVRLRTKPAKVLSYVDWKEKMVKEENDEIPPDADEGDLYLRLMELIALKDLSTWELRQVIDFVEKLRPKEGKN